MWIVELALRRPYTFLVMALLILLATPLVLLKMSTDIFPEINIPVISIVWTYTGLSAQEIGNRITAVNERSLTTTVNDIEHIESESLAGFSIIKIFFQPNANIPTAIAQVVAIEQSQLRQLPPGILPPLVIKYSASSIPIIQLGVSSPTMTEQAVFDAAVNFLRPRLVTIPGVAIPYPYGGKQRVISVDLDTNALLAKGLTPTDVVNAINVQNLILPSGTAKIGSVEYVLATNASPDTITELNRIPVVTRNGATTYISEVAHVRDGFSPQTNIVRQNGERPGVDHQERRLLDARHRIEPARPVAPRRADFAEGHQDRAAVRSIGFRARRHHRGGARSGHRRLLDRGAHPAVPRQLAQHLHHRRVDSAVDPHLDHYPLRPRRDAQHHDAGRARARGRDSGR
jgi:multidrug efflux pump subunit AcrB